MNAKKYISIRRKIIFSETFFLCVYHQCCYPWVIKFRTKITNNYKIQLISFYFFVHFFPNTTLMMEFSNQFFKLNLLIDRMLIVQDLPSAVLRQNLIIYRLMGGFSCGQNYCSLESVYEYGVK